MKTRSGSESEFCCLQGKNLWVNVEMRQAEMYSLARKASRVPNERNFSAAYDAKARHEDARRCLAGHACARHDDGNDVA